MKTNKGFSLVELVVVIAIMAIIAGVSVPVYNMYIDKANKGNDIELVGEIIRAVEIGVNSTMISAPEPLNFGATNYPVAFIALDSNGYKIYSSKAEKPDVSGECNFVTEKVATLSYTVQTENCDGTLCLGSASGNLYAINTVEEITYCTTHSLATPEEANNSKYPTARSFKYDKNIIGIHSNHRMEPTAYLNFDGKAEKVVEYFDYVHSVDSLKLFHDVCSR